MFGIEISAKTILTIMGLCIGGIIAFKLFTILLKILDWFLAKILVFVGIIAFILLLYVSLKINGTMEYYPKADHVIQETIKEQYEKGIKITEDGKLNLNHTVNHIVYTTKEITQEGINATKKINLK